MTACAGEWTIEGDSDEWHAASKGYKQYLGTQQAQVGCLVGRGRVDCF